MLRIANSNKSLYDNFSTYIILLIYQFYLLYQIRLFLSFCDSTFISTYLQFINHFSDILIHMLISQMPASKNLENDVDVKVPLTEEVNFVTNVKLKDLQILLSMFVKCSSNSTSNIERTLNMFICQQSSSNTQFLPSNERTSNIEHCSTDH